MTDGDARPGGADGGPDPGTGGGGKEPVAAERSPSGFTLAQAVFAIAVLALIAGLALPLASQVLSANRSAQTRDQLVRLRRALVGPPEGSDLRAEPDFGYLADFGALPDSLPLLLHRGGRPEYGVSGASRLGFGWRGPYYPIALLDDTAEIRTDAFGRSIRYATRDSSVGSETWDGWLRSAGPDGEFGTGDDLLEAIPKSRTTGRVVGIVADTAGAPRDSIPVFINFRTDSGLVQTRDTTDLRGRYSASGLPFGTTAVSLGQFGAEEGNLEVMEDSVFLTGGGSKVEFVVENTGGEPVDLTGWTATYDDKTRPLGLQTIFYGQVKELQPKTQNIFGGCAGSGDAIAFSDIITVGPVSGTAVPAHPGGVQTLTLDGPVVQVSDTLRVVSTASAGAGQVKFQIAKFRTNSDCTGTSSVDLTNRDFTIEFSDGSTVTFTTPSS